MPINDPNHISWAELRDHPVTKIVSPAPVCGEDHEAMPFNYCPTKGCGWTRQSTIQPSPLPDPERALARRLKRERILANLRDVRNDDIYDHLLSLAILHDDHEIIVAVNDWLEFNR